MSLLLGGLGYPQLLVTGGLGARSAQTAHVSLFETPVADPDNFDDPNYGDEGDLEYATWEPTSHGQYNGRSLVVYLPTGTVLPPRSLSRMQNLMRLMKPLTASIRVKEVGGPTLFELHDEAEESRR